MQIKVMLPFEATMRQAGRVVHLYKLLTYLIIIYFIITMFLDDPH